MKKTAKVGPQVRVTADDLRSTTIIIANPTNLT